MVGAFGFYQWLHTTGPVLFKEEGVKSVIENNANAAFEEVSAKPGAPTMGMTVHNPTLSVGGTFDTPTLSGALFHQSTFNNLFIEGLSVTAGLRLDYEKISMKYNSLSTPIVGLSLMAFIIEFFNSVCDKSENIWMLYPPER